MMELTPLAQVGSQQQQPYTRGAGGGGGGGGGGRGGGGGGGGYSSDPMGLLDNPDAIPSGACLLEDDGDDEDGYAV
jgi:hypothetical protein